MEEELFRSLLNDPVAGGGTIVTAIAGILYFVRKGYLSLKADGATTEAVTTSLSSQTQVIQMLREEVARLSNEVAQVRNQLNLRESDHAMLEAQLASKQLELDNCIKQRDSNHGIQQ